MFVSDLRDFLDLPDDAPGPARRMAEHLGSIVRAATSRESVDPWETALPCRRRPGNRRCPGHIAVYRHEVEGRIEWSCVVCDDQGVTSKWEGSPFDLRRTGSEQDLGSRAVVLSTEDWATVRSLSLLDSDCERLVYSATPAGSNVVFETDIDGLENLLEHVAAEANHEEERRKQKRLDRAIDVLERQLYEIEAGAGTTKSPPDMAPVLPINAKQSSRRSLPGLAGKWRIVEMDLWDQKAIDLVGPAFIQFVRGRHGSLGFIAVQAGLDWRSSAIEGKQAVEFSWQGFDEGDEVGGRGWAALEPDGNLTGHIYFHLGDDSGFRARRL
jgi:hypothetical protein